MLTVIQNLLAFLVAIFLLVTVHEFGHFWVARRLGFKVTRFSVGFGPPLWRRVAADGTEYWLSALPFGGYVKLLDEREGPVPEAELAGAFTRRPHWQRILVLLAGPAFNFIFAIVVLSGLFMAKGISDLRPLVGEVTSGSPAARAGLRTGDEIVAINGHAVEGQRPVVIGLLDDLSEDRPVELQVRGSDGLVRSASIDLGSATERRTLSEPMALLSGIGFAWVEPPEPAILGSVESGGPAAQAGLRSGDEIVSFNAEPITGWTNLVSRINAHPNESASIHYRRGGTEYATRVAIVGQTEKGKLIGRIHVDPPALITLPPEFVRHVSLDPLQSVEHAGIEAWTLTSFQARAVWRILTGSFSVKNLNGPITIAQMAGSSALQGPSTFLEFLVLISLALGFMNLLPIPILDGGQVVMQAIEWLKGRPLSERAQAAGQQVGLAMVVLLLSIALFNDIVRQFG
jgi:regulator of sigma E protease